MAQAFFPDSRLRSATASSSQSDYRDENIFSSIVLAHGGGGQQKTFTVPQGQTIPALKGSTITVAQAHQVAYTEQTTNLTQAGQLGASIGDASIRAIGLMLEQAPVDTSGNIQAWGATQLESMDVASKVFFQFKVAGKVQIQGPTTLFPAPGGIFGFTTSTVTAVLTNGPMGVPRKLRMQIPVARTDNLEGVIGVAGSATLAFRTTTGAGAASLLWVVLAANVRGDVR
jgi:hypothetical protein